jgi:cation diffusion facilitator family transporter
MLAAALDARDRGSSQRPSTGGRQTPPLCRMEQPDLGDLATDERASEAANSGFNLGKLWHARSRSEMWLTASLENRQLAVVTRTSISPFRGSDAARARGHVARSPAVRRVLVVVLLLNALVAFVKVVVGIRTGALTVLGAALESSLDMFNNVIGVMLVRVAGRGPDEDHPYGHDKFETLGALGIVGFLSISCFELLREGVSSLMERRTPVSVGGIDLAVLVLTLAVNVVVVIYERRRGRELGSAFLMADAAHTGSDILVTLLALGSLLLSRGGWAHLDAVLAIVVALIIAWSGYRILRESIPILVDERAIAAQELRSVVLAVPDIRDVRKVRSRSTASGQLFAEVTIAVSGSTSVDEAHRLADAVEEAIAREFGTSEVTVHVEPA